MCNCTWCGTPLQPGMTVCPRCGKFTSEQALSRTSTGADARTIAAAAAPANYQVPFPSSPPPIATPPAGYGNRQPYPQQQQTPQSYMPYGQPPLAAPPLQPLPTGKPRNNKGISKGVTLLLTIMALLMMIGGATLIYYTTVAQPGQFRAQATATVQTLLTDNAHATATTQTQATATAQAQARSTATAQTQAQATATTLQSIYTTATSGTPALTSSLAFQDGTRWDLYSAVGGGGCAFTGSALHASIFQQHTYAPCFAQATNFSNFAFQVQMTILKGDGGGLVFRADDVNAKFYLLHISHNGVFSLLVTRDAKTNTPLLDDTSTAINTGAQTNLVTVIARDSTLYMYVNKQFIGTTNDSTYTTGKIGVFADDTTTATEVAFSNVNVWTL